MNFWDIMVNGEVIVVDDDYSNTITNNYTELAYSIERELLNYVNVLNQIVDNKILEGETANKLNEFAYIVKNTLGNALTECVKQFAVSMENYIEEIDKADDAFY